MGRRRAHPRGALSAAVSAAPAAAPPTRLQRAFEQMRKEGRLIVEENCACCSSCAHAECWKLLRRRRGAVGYVFYHGQDLDCAADGALWLGHAAQPDLPDEAAALVATQALRDQGLEVEWDGDADVRIKVLLPEGPERAYFQRQLNEEYACW